MSKKPVIQLKPAQRRQLLRTIRRGKRKARDIRCAYILLRSADGWSETEIADAFDISPRTVRRTRARDREQGGEAALSEHPRPGQPPKLTLRQETRSVALACSQPPAGHQRWTVRLLTEEAIQRKIVRRIAPETARRVLKKSSEALACPELVHA
ncbi:MAG: helix-turn-helix domain-containing protein [Anaerolineae bacterium]